MTSPTLMSWNFSRPMPHSKPFLTSEASSLKRLSEARLPSQTTTLSRSRRALAVRRIVPVEHQAAGDGADLGDLEHLADLGVAELLLLEGRLEQTDHRLLEVVGEVVDHRVEADVDLLALRQLLGRALGAHVEADDDRLRRGREQDVVGGDGADRGVDEVDRDLVGGELGEGVAQHLDRALHVGLEHDVERLDLVGLDLVHQVFEGDLAAGGHLLLALLGLTVAGDLAGPRLVLDDLEGVAGLGDVLEAHDLDRVGRAGLRAPACGRCRASRARARRSSRRRRSRPGSACPAARARWRRRRGRAPCAPRARCRGPAPRAPP